jgi:hypothetical protein
MTHHTVRGTDTWQLILRIEPLRDRYSKFRKTSAGARAMHGFGAEVCVEEVQ